MRLVSSLVLVGLIGVAGCGTRQTKGTVSTATRTAENPWPTAISALRKETTPGGLGRVLGELTAATTVEEKYRPDALEPAAEAAVKTLAKLTDDDLKSIRPAGYSALDPHYLAECLYLRDVARGLELDGRPPAEQAHRAFAWVCRQVVLNPWQGHSQSTGGQAFFPPVPPSYILRRGSGSGLERMYATAALCQQLGLDVVLVGPADAGDKAWQHDPTRQPNQPPRGPFWALGVRVDGDVHLFDPWKGVQVTANDGKAVTLAQAVADPSRLKDAPAPADQIKASVPFLSVPIASLAPRLKRLEGELKADVRLFVDLAAEIKEFADATKVSPQVWNPATDVFAYPRVLAGFIPPADGGASPDPTLIAQYKASQLPLRLFRFSFAPGLMGDPNDSADLGSPDAVRLLQEEAVNRVGGQFLGDPGPRERVQRGQPDAVRQLVSLRDEYAKGLERLRTDRDRDRVVRDWVTQARDRSRKVAVARDRNPAALTTAEAEFQKFTQDTRREWMVLVDLAVADIGAAEATYLIALAKHEQAVQTQSRANRQPTESNRQRAADAWTEARGWWGRYEPFATGQDQSFPGRAVHAKRLADEAAKGAGG